MNVDECVIRTLSYFDIFDYPLTFSEIKKHLCCRQEIADDELYDSINLLSVVQELDGFYYLLGRSKIVQMRNERYEISSGKLAKAKILSKILSYIPTIKYVGISGSLSMNNAALSDDIDLFFITRKNTLWITRFLVNAVLILLRQKRKKKNKDSKDKICPNMFMDESRLTFGSAKRTLYTAHEIVQLKSVEDKYNSYQALLQKNKWIRDYLPNIKIEQVRTRRVGLVKKLLIRFIQPIEKISYLLQKAYMRKTTGETIQMTKAAFHPIDRQKIIMDVYSLRVNRYKKLYVDNYWVDSDEARFYMDEKKIRILN